MPATSTSARFVGREGAFAELARPLEAAASGEAGTVLVAGPGGIGVSRFISETARRLTALPEPFLVLRGRAMPAAADDPYEPILRALRPRLAELDDADLVATLGPGAEDLVRLLPELTGRLARVGALPARPTITSAERRHGRVLEGILGVVVRIAERSPVLLVLEDLHHADAATRAFTSFLARVRRHDRVCVLATYQPDQLTRGHPLAVELGSLAASIRPPRVLELPPLDRAELADLIEGIEGERPTASILLLVAERSGGSPLVAEELLAARRELAGAPLAGTFEALVTARLAARSPECRRVLRLLALARRPLSEAELADVAAAYELTADRLPPRSVSGPRRGTGALDADLTAGLAEALEHGILVREPAAESAMSDPGIEFRHELIGRAAAADLLPRQKHRHHLALATGLAAHPTAAAIHWHEAHVPERAYAAAVDAAGRAEAVHAPEDALAALELALSLVDPANADTGGSRRAKGGDPEATTALAVRAAEAAFAAGQPARAVAYTESVMSAFDERRDRTPLALLHERLGRYRRAAGDSAGSLSALQRAVSLVPREASVERATVLAALAQAMMLDGTFSEAERHARQAIEVARACAPDGQAQAAHATTTLGVSLGWGETPEEGVALLGRARELAEAAGDHDELFRVFANLTTVLDLLGRRGEAVEVAYEGIEATRRAGLEAVYGNFLRGNAADSLFLLGRWDEARALSETALEWSPTGLAFVSSVDSLAIVEIETRAGESAGRLLGQLLLELATVEDAQHAVPVYRAAASFALWQGDHVDARRAAERGWALVSQTEDWSLIAKMAATVAEVDAAAAIDARARRDLAGLAEARGRSTAVIRDAEKAVRASGVDPAFGSRQEADAWLATAAAQRARLDGAADPAAWERLAGIWAALGNPYEVARARWRQAEATLESGAGRSSRGAARPALLEAARIGVELAARPLLREVRELAGRAMINLPSEVDACLADELSAEAVAASLATGPTNGHHADDAEVSPLVRGVVGEAKPARGDTFGLSRREHEVLGLIAEGRTNREIGERLFISQKTVGVHVGNILAKLGVSGRVEAAAVAIRLGMTEAAAAGSGPGR